MRFVLGVTWKDHTHSQYDLSEKEGRAALAKDIPVKNPELSLDQQRAAYLKLVDQLIDEMDLLSDLVKHFNTDLPPYR